ncbi:phospho-N-acetylmuramoyl-pentapeptide-transferase [Eubacteriaceae bacterium ES2]|nr:phospho-N-acetylmuramoyl-pentapeptide-transferase [Eubacteriaceae bacterium ES2]
MEEAIKSGLLALLSSFLLVYILTPRFIPMLKRLKFGQAIREEGPQSHLAKSGTPTMGGIVIIAGLVISVLVFALLTGMVEVLPVAMVLYFGAIGFVDDYIKVVKKHNLGLRAWQKLVLQFVGALAFSLYAFLSPEIGSLMLIPFSGAIVDMGIMMIPFTFFAIVAVVNAVNLTDGLDGLASGVTLIVAIFFFVIAALIGKTGTAIFIGSVMGALMGFLRYNSNPADIFMGDTGSMALGGAVIGMAIVLQMQWFVLIAGALYVIEALSVLIQVGYFKLTKGKRFFKMAPIHHHFELKGWSETRVVTVFWMVSGLFVTIAFLAFI